MRKWLWGIQVHDGHRALGFLISKRSSDLCPLKEEYVSFSRDTAS